jgi:uncharacterized membrane protein YebE (DUF533 family)
MKRLTLSGDACVETLALLITFAWADGKLEESEKKGVRAAAEVMNLEKELRDRLEKLLQKPMPIEELLVEQLGPNRAFAFVAATWMTGVDDEVDAKEQQLLDKLASMLEFDSDKTTELTKIARDLESVRSKDGDWSDDVIKLFKAIPARLEGGSEEIVVEFD